MKGIVRVFVSLLVAMAVVILVVSPNTRQVADPGDRIYPVTMGVLVVLSVTLLHWLLERYITAVDLYTPSNRARLLHAAESNYRKGFFRGTVGIGYLLVFSYAMDIAGIGFHRESPSGVGYLFVGVVFIFLGIVARARGIILSLLELRSEPHNRSRDHKLSANSHRDD